MRREGEQLWDDLHADQDAPEPTASGRRPRALGSARASVRPSAFGPPRPSQPPSAALSTTPARDESQESEPTPSGTRLTTTRAQSEHDPAGDSSTDQASGVQLRPRSEHPAKRSTTTMAPRATSQSAVQPLPGREPSTPPPMPTPGFRGDLEDLLPFVGARSRFPAAPSFAAPQPSPQRHDGRRTRASMLIFGAMLLASAIPLVRYAGAVETAAEPSSAAQRTASAPLTAAPSDAVDRQGERASGKNEAAPAAASEPSAASGVSRARAEEDKSVNATAAQTERDEIKAALARIEATLPSNATKAADQLVRIGLQELAAGQHAMAEALFASALSRDDDNSRAYYGLARIRLHQGNVEGAEGWIVSALRKRPKRAEYHSLYAVVLERLGRRAEAARARARAAELVGRSY